MTEANTDNKSNAFRWFTGGVIVLMIVLMVFSSNTLNRQAHEQHGVLIGHASDGDVMSQDSQYATRLLDQLQAIYIVFPPTTPTGEPQLAPLLTACWGEPVIRDLKAHPDALYLVLRESRRVSPGVSPFALGPLEPERQSQEQMGLMNSGRVDLDDLRPLPSSPLGQMRARNGRSFAVELRIVQRTNDGRAPEYQPNSLPPLEQASIYAAMNDFFTIQSAASLPLNAVKPTSPMIDRFLAQQFQTFTLQLAAVDARPLVAKVPEPTDEQLRAQLNQYAADLPGRVNLTNRFGFGYRVPDRVKLETISYKRADVRSVVQAEKTPYEWEVAARMAYAKNPAAFSPPTTQPTTAPAASFESVRDRAIASVIDQATDARAAELEKAIRSPMAADYQQWAKSGGATTAPADGATISPAVAAPNTSFGVPYDSGDYLQKLAAAVQARFKVLPTVESYTDRFRDERALGLIGGFNDATREVPQELARRSGRDNATITGPVYAIEFSKDLLEPQAQDFLGGQVLERYRPSERLESRRGVGGSEREVFFFRVTNTERNHPRTEIEPIRDVLKNNWKTAEAQKLALEQAKAAVAAVTAGNDFVAAVNGAMPGSAVIKTDVGPFHSPPPEGSPLGLSTPAYAQFGVEVTEHLLGADAKVAALDVPIAAKAYAANRLAVHGDWADEEELRSLRQGLRSRYAVQMSLPKSDQNPVGMAPYDIAAAWLDSKHIFERLAYKSVRDDDASK